MKTTVCLATLLLTLFLCPNLTFAQLGGYGGGNNADTWADKNYPENQLLVAYLPGTTTEEKQAVRGFYSITDVEEVNNELELWYEISFPIEVQEEQNGAPHTVTLYDVEELLANLDVQNNSTSNHDDARAQVNSGDFNYELNLLEINPSYYSGPMQILPDCREDAHRFSGPAGPFSSGEISVVVMDQAFNFMNATMTGNIRVIDGPLGGGNISLASHADQIGFIIQQSLATANLDVTFFNVAIFDPSGESSYADLIQGFKWLKDNSIQNCVINLSASMTVESSVFSQPIWNYIDNIITNQNLLLVSSAGNDGYGDDTIVLPGCAGMPHEITVAGTSACFSAPWSLSNSNTVSFEIAAEAEQVLVPISTYTFGLGSGTSYSTAMVSAALMQLSTYYPTFDAQQLKSTLIASADEVAALDNTVADGRVLNLSSAVLQAPTLRAAPHQAQSFPTADALPDGIALPAGGLSVYPNPFTDRFQLNLPAMPMPGNGMIRVYNSLGQMVWQQFFAAQLERTTLEVQLPSGLPAGSYWLKGQVGDQVFTQPLIKR